MRPIEHLPVPFPAEYDPADEQEDIFYHNFVKHFIPDMIQMSEAGLRIDQDAVEDLRVVIDNVLKAVQKTLEGNKLIAQYQEHVYPVQMAEHRRVALQAIREPSHYLKEYAPKNMTHRTWVVNCWLDANQASNLMDDKWTVSHLKKTNVFIESAFLSRVIDGTVSPKSKFVIQGMENLSVEQARIWNLPRYAKADIPVVVPEFNPGSNKQLQEFFEMLEIEPITISAKTGNASWDRDNIEILFKTNTDEDLLEVLQAIIDHSFSGIIKNNFLNAFDNFTIDGVLYGNIRLFGAKSFRNTSNSPNLLNMPSTRSIYAKPLKKCFIASEGRVIYAIDLKALEDRGIANLSGDVNKQNIFLENLDGHSLNACGYFPEEIEKILGRNTDNVNYVREFYKQEQAGNADLAAIRFKSKAPTFKLAYGGYPDDHKGGVITQDIFNNYHNILYPDITRYREQYVLPFVQEHGYIHLGLGCRMYASNAEDSIRTLNNATVQFWSILTLIAINELNHRIREAGLEDRMDVISTIYDSVYVDVDNDPEIIKWLNDNLVELITVQWLQEEVVHNEAIGEIGLNWSELHKIPNGASVIEITTVLEKL